MPHPARRLFSLTALAGALLLAACAGAPITGPVCTGLVSQDRGLPPPSLNRRGAAASPEDSLAGNISSRVERVIAAQVSNDARAEAIMEGAPEDGLRQARPERRVATLNVLAMTTGGQYGAFSSGFLTGWSERRDGQARPDFALVTGASAGGIIAPIAFAGPEFNEMLRLNTGIGNKQVVRARFPLELLSSPSLYGTGPLEKAVRLALTDALIERVGEQFRNGSDLLLGATNLKTGRFDLMDLGSFAGSDLPIAKKRDCMTEAILATSAIPALFPPRTINDQLYTDAGVRQSVFLTAIRDAELRSEQRLGIDLRVNAYVIVNSDLVVKSGPVETGLLGVAGRSFELIADEGLRQSLLDTVALSRRSGWRLRAIIAPSVVPPEGKPCPDCDDLFSPTVTRALFDAGRAMALAPEIPWISAASLAARAREY